MVSFAARHRARSRLASMSESRSLRLVVYFLLYFSQGVPIGLWTVAVPSWLAANGASPGEIGGFIGTVMIPWALFKLFYGPLMDRFTFSPMGRRRIWLIGAQAIAVLAILPLVWIDPDPGQLGTLTVIALVMNVALTVQDTAIDGMAVDLTPAGERAHANATMLAGQIIGVAISAAVSGYLINAYGFAWMAISFQVVLFACLIVVVSVRERSGEKLLPWTAGKASSEASALSKVSWSTVFGDLFSTLSKLHILFFGLAFAVTGISYAAMDVGGPVYAATVLGWSGEGYSALAGIAGLIAGILGMLWFGTIADKVGRVRISLLLFLSLGAGALLFLMLAAPFSSSLAFNLFVMFHFLVLQVLTIALAATAMSLCKPTIAASQFSILIALPNLARVFSSSQIGRVHDLGGLNGIWGLLAFSAFAGIVLLVAFAISLKIQNHRDANHD